MRVPSQYLAGQRASGFDSAVLTPLIDIVFQLLIFFICASIGQTRELLLPADLASGTQATTGPALERPLGEVWIRVRTVDQRSRFTIEGIETEDWRRVDALLATLAETAREIPVILDFGPDVPMGDVVRLYDRCRGVGLTSLSFAAGSISPTRQ